MFEYFGDSFVVITIQRKLRKLKIKKLAPFPINQFTSLINTGLQGFVVGQLGVISKLIFCTESGSSHRIGPSCQNFGIFELNSRKTAFCII